ncbi:nucleoside diphosphate kinase, putative [Eimeria tenella]|uniref:Nucleoside diphosphate kinase, putative n=1 Tax=Eimeria tenella TaxID=5802 RepID=U6KN39_EIMTE|nr:nucleoside diphosphate kinase, putative [Eimeria tenella]CDJ39507.1 nucleoside diphosphate kinase, putative [Eimeria tenella]|eukprot:XP_013230262.1 nucleoside diphosphate kinase, putative [Eimeria tenella]
MESLEAQEAIDAMKNRGLLYTADLSPLLRKGLAAAPHVLQRLLQQAAAQQLQARVLLLHGPPETTEVAAEAAKEVLPGTVVADAEALLSLEQQQEQRYQQQHLGSSCCYCGVPNANCECLDNVSVFHGDGVATSSSSCSSKSKGIFFLAQHAASVSQQQKQGLLLSRAINKLAWLRTAPLVALRLPPSLLSLNGARTLDSNCSVAALLHLLPVTATEHVEEEGNLPIEDQEPPSAALLHFATEGKAKRILVVTGNDPLMLREELSSVLRPEVAAVVSPKGLATPIFGQTIAKLLGLRLIPDFDQHVKQQQQQQQPLHQGSTTGATPHAVAAGGAVTGLAKAIQQAKGNLRAPTVIAEAIRVLRRPQGKAVSNGVLLLDVLDSVELVCSKSNKIAEVYKDRCVRINLSAAAAAAALEPSLESSGEGDDEDSSVAAAAAAKAAANAASEAVKEISAALMKPPAILLTDGFLQQEAATAVRQALALSLSCKLHVLDNEVLGKEKHCVQVLEAQTLSTS